LMGTVPRSLFDRAASCSFGRIVAEIQEFAVALSHGEPSDEHRADRALGPEQGDMESLDSSRIS
jgi:hypothetical protein